MCWRRRRSPDAAEDDAGRVRGRAAGRPHREGHGAGRDRCARRLGRAGARDRVHRGRRPRSLHGGTDDDLQHVDRGGRARGDDRARRGHASPTSRGAPAFVRGGLASTCTLRRRRARTTRCASSTSRRSSRRSPGGRIPGWSCRSTGSCPTRPTSPTRTSASRSSGRSATWARARHAADGDRHRPGVHRLLHERAHRGSPRRRRGRLRPPRGRRGAGDRGAGLGAGEAPGRGGGAATTSSSARASSGAMPAARCAWA